MSDRETGAVVGGRAEKGEGECKGEGRCKFCLCTLVNGYYLICVFLLMVKHTELPWCWCCVGGGGAAAADENT